MNLVTVARTLVRRWVVLVPLLALTALAALVVGRGVAPTYEHTASVVIFPPTLYVSPDGSTTKVNPFQRAGTSGEGFMATTLVTLAASESFAARLEAAGLKGKYEVSMAPMGGGAILDIRLIGASAPSVAKDLDLVEAELRRTLMEQQRVAGAPESTYLRLQELTRRPRPTLLTIDRIKVMAVVVLLGVLAAVAAALAADRGARTVSLRRRRAAAEPRSAHAHAAPVKRMPTVDDPAKDSSRMLSAVAGRRRGE